MAREKKKNGLYRSADIVVISILPKVELQAILREFERQWPTAPKQSLPGSTTVFEITTNKGWQPRVAVRAIHEAGNLTSAIETSNLLNRFMPRFAFLCGIAGNVNSDKRNLGDVIVSASCGYRQATRMSEGRVIEWAMPGVPAIGRKMLDRAGVHFGETELDFDGDDVLEYFQGKKCPHPTSVEVGKIFCWDLVLDCDETRKDLLNMDREYRAVEMEFVGFLKAIAAFRDLRQHPVDALAFRGLSDPASKKTQSDASPFKYRAYAARNAARALVSFIASLSESDCIDEAF